jgi:hypothetical protein
MLTGQPKLKRSIFALIIASVVLGLSLLWDSLAGTTDLAEYIGQRTSDNIGTILALPLAPGIIVGQAMSGGASFHDTSNVGFLAGGFGFDFLIAYWILGKNSRFRSDLR